MVTRGKDRIIEINEIDLKVNQDERSYLSSGDMALDSRVIDMYKQNKFYDAPKDETQFNQLSSQEKKKWSGWNAMSTSIANLKFQQTDGKTSLSGIITPTRYLNRIAAQNVTNTNNYNDKQLAMISPNMANISAITPIIKDGIVYIISQIKGANTQNGGSISVPLVAGGIDAKTLLNNRYLDETLKKETFEEIGINLGTLDFDSFHYLNDELEVGSVNLTTITQNVGLEDVLENYNLDSIKKLNSNQNLEVQGIGLIPMYDISNQKYICDMQEQNGIYFLNNLETHRPTKSGLIKNIESLEAINPFSTNWINFLTKDVNNLSGLLQHAGMYNKLS